MRKITLPKHLQRQNDGPAARSRCDETESPTCRGGSASLLAHGLSQHAASEPRRLWTFEAAEQGFGDLCKIAASAEDHELRKLFSSGIE